MQQWLRSSLIRLGRAGQSRLNDWKANLTYFGETSAESASVLLDPHRFRWRFFWYYLDLCGRQALPIVLMISILMGVTMAFQTAVQMRKFGTEIMVVDLVGFATLKEFGPLMVALIATGRAGSAFAAEIGAMKAEEELNALTTMGISPVRFLVVPKLFAMMIALPVLTVFGDLAGLFGGLLVGVGMVGIPAGAYLSRTLTVLSPPVFLLGVLKSLFFGILIALVGCRNGFRSGTDAQGVGRAATAAVVESLFVLVAADTVLTVIYSLWGY